jgi:hypothetical protein
VRAAVYLSETRHQSPFFRFLHTKGLNPAAKMSRKYVNATRQFAPEGIRCLFHQTVQAAIPVNCSINVTEFPDRSYMTGWTNRRISN